MSTIDRGRLTQTVLIVVLVGIGFAIFYELRPFLGGFLGALTLYILLRPAMQYLHKKRKWPKALAATVLILASILLLIVPIGGVAQLLYSKLSNLEFNSNQVYTGIVGILSKVKEHTGVELMSSNTLADVEKMLGNMVQSLLNTTYSLALNVIMLCFILFFMFTNVEQLDKSIRSLIPLKKQHADKLIDESRKMVISNAIGIPLLAAIQGFVSGVGYWIFGVSDPVFWGVITGFFSIAPIVGTAIIWIPLSAYLMISGEVGQGIGLLLFGLIVVSSSDNLIRFVLQKRMADVHPIVTVLGVIVGVGLFGMLGIIFGPLLFSLFFLLFKIYRYEYGSSEARE